MRKPQHFVCEHNERKGRRTIDRFYLIASKKKCVQQFFKNNFVRVFEGLKNTVRKQANFQSITIGSSINRPSYLEMNNNENN